MIVSLFLCSGLLLLLVLSLSWPAYLIQHRGARLAADNAGDAVTQKLGRFMESWAIQTLFVKEQQFNREVDERMRREPPDQLTRVRQEVAQAIFPHPADSLRALARHQRPIGEAVQAQVWPHEAGCGLKQVTVAHRGELEATAREYARANGATDVTEFQAQIERSRVRFHFFAERAVKLPIFSDRLDPSRDRTRAEGIDEITHVYGVPVIMNGPCP